MKFLCEQCKTKYQISDEKIAGKTVRMKCRKCGFNIEVSSEITESSVAQKLNAPQAPKAPVRSSLTTGLSAPARPVAKPSPLSGALKDSVRDEASSALEILQVSSSGDWYAAINGVPVGPIRVGELRQKAAQGLVTEDTLVWQEGLEEWRPVRAMPELAKLVRDAQQRQSLTPAPPSNQRASRPPPPPPRKSLTPRPPAARGQAPKTASSVMAGADVDIDALFSPALSQPPPAPTPAPPAAANPFSLTPGPGEVASDPFASPTRGATPAPGAASFGAGASFGGASPFAPAQASPFASLDVPVRASTPPPAAVAAFDGSSERRQRAAPPPWIIIAMLVAALGFGGVAAYAIFLRQPQSVVVQMIAPPTATTTASSATPTETAAPTDSSAPASSVASATRPTGGQAKSNGGSGATAPTNTGKGVDPNIAGLLGGTSGPDPKGPSGPSTGGGSSLTASQIEGVVANRKLGVRRQCWDKITNHPPSVKVVARVNVNGSGTVTNVSTDGNDPVVAKCIEGQVRGWTFPPTGASSTVDIPFTFLSQ